MKIGGVWNEEEQSLARNNEINVLELKAALLALKAFCSKIRECHVHMKIDNTTAVAYLNHMGGTKSEACDSTAKNVWSFCIERNIWISASHIPGVDNVEADEMSRNFSDQLEWQLNKKVFKSITGILGNPEVDLFATRLNAQTPTFVSWRPEPDALATDAFLQDWGKWSFYAFPPFCLVAKCIQKLCLDKAEGILVVPYWPSQTWFSRIVDLLVQDPVLLPDEPDLLVNSITGGLHPLLPKLKLICCRLSGQRWRAKAYQATRLISSYNPGEIPQEHNTALLSKNGFIFVTATMAIPLKRI